MATPTDQQQIRATLRRAERNMGTERAAYMAVDEAAEILGESAMLNAALERLPVLPEDGSAAEMLPPLLGAAEAADVLGMKATNLKRLSPPLPVAAVISGRIPVYRESDVMAAKRRRDARRAA
jgi:hypothetical protein